MDKQQPVCKLAAEYLNSILCINLHSWMTNQ